MLPGRMGGGTLSLFAPEHPARGRGDVCGDGLEWLMGSLGVAGVGAVLRTGGEIALVWVLVVFMAGLALAPHVTLAKLLGSPHDVFFPFLEMWMKAPLHHTLPWSCGFRLPPPNPPPSLCRVSISSQQRPGWWETPTRACLCFIFPQEILHADSFAMGAGVPWVPFAAAGTPVGAALAPARSGGPRGTLPGAGTALCHGERGGRTQPGGAGFNYRN